MDLESTSLLSLFYSFSSVLAILQWIYNRIHLSKMAIMEDMNFKVRFISNLLSFISRVHELISHCIAPSLILMA